MPRHHAWQWLDTVHKIQLSIYEGTDIMFIHDKKFNINCTCMSWEISAFGWRLCHIYHQTDCLDPRKFKGGICCGGHLAVTYWGELLYLQIFFVAKPAKQFC